ncbi:OLC1v1034498C1 [Oldenlandia corymbosa var. corymbosa]|nr:OLC1v1034498C1 [Oldenlandia corymbosa var. corymbosa]
MDLHCEGCAKKVKRAVRNFGGVEEVKTDCDTNKITVKGNVDPSWVREKVEQKYKKKVELVSPQPKKDAGGGDKKADDKSDKKPADDKKKDDANKKPKEPQVSTVVLKIKLHCDGCAQKIKRKVRKFDGVDEVKVDSDKDLVTAKGTMDPKELASYLKDITKRPVDIVPPPKKDDGGGDKKGKEGGGGGDKKDAEKPKEGGGGGGGDKKDKEKESGGGGGEKKKDGGEDKGKSVEESKVEIHKSEYHGYASTSGTAVPYTTGYYQYGVPAYNHAYAMQDYGVQPAYNYQIQEYGHSGHVVEYHRPHYEPPPPPPTFLPTHDQMFSDENPNACSLM